MIKIFKHKILNVFLIISLLAHIGIAHDLLQNYVICYAVDGSTQIEKIDDLGKCANHSTFKTDAISKMVFSNLTCEDVNLEKKCFGEEQFIFKNRINLDSGFQKKDIFIFITENYKTTFNKIKIDITGNNILESYSTVSLII